MARSKFKTVVGSPCKKGYGFTCAYGHCKKNIDDKAKCHAADGPFLNELVTMTGSYPRIFNCIGKQAQTPYPVDGLSMVVLFRRDVCKHYMKVHSTVRF